MAAMIITTDLSDELFPPEVRQLELVPATSYTAECLICGLSNSYPLQQPALCGFCLEDVPRARARVASQRESASACLVEAEAAYQVAVATADPEDKRRLATIELLRQMAPRSQAARSQLHAYLTNPGHFGERFAALVRVAQTRAAAISLAQCRLSRCDRADSALNLLST